MIYTNYTQGDIMKKILCFLGVVVFAFGILLLPHKGVVYANMDTDINHKSHILIERKTGKVLAESASHDRLPIASVTKLMTILLTLERIDAGELSVDDTITVSANASGMGGSQIFLDANAEYKIGELLKSVIVASANDSSVALAEQIAGSENNFVREMNVRARDLGLVDTNYSNCTGLPSVDAYSSAHDQAIVLNKVLDYDLYHEYSSIWMENFQHPSGRTTQMTNTNKLSRFYPGCIGGKTGSTSIAKYCLAVGAERDGMSYIAVVLGVDNSKSRFKLASDLLDYGFDNFETKMLFSNSNLSNYTIAVKGMDRRAKLKAEREYSMVVGRGEQVNYSLNYNLPTSLKSVDENDVVGNVEIVVDGIVVDTINILSCDTHKPATIWDYFKEITEIA